MQGDCFLSWKFWYCLSMAKCFLCYVIVYAIIYIYLVMVSWLIFGGTLYSAATHKLWKKLPAEINRHRQATFKNYVNHIR